MRTICVTRLALAAFLTCAAPAALFAQATVAPAAPAKARQAAAPARVAQAGSTALDRLFSAAVKPSDPGLAVIVARNGRVVHRAGYGLANVELGVKATPEHVFRIGSVTKQFTAALVMMLVEEGTIALDDPLTKFLPDYPTQGRTITVEHLLTHTSGIQSYTDMPRWRSMFRQDLSLDELIAVFKNEPMSFAPGERWRYNNSGYVLLGAIIEKVTGKPYAEVLRTRIFGPLGMADTRYDATEQIVPRRAAGYARAREGLVNAQYLSMSQPHAAGALVSTVDDLAKWDAGLNGGKVVKPTSLQRMWTSYRLASGAPTQYGYGWGLGSYAGRDVQAHGGGIHGFRSYVLRIPKDGVYVAVLSNLAAQEPDPEMLARRAAALAIGVPQADPPAVPMTPEQLDAYVGRFVTKPGDRFVVSRDGASLFVQIGGSRVAIVPSGHDSFFERGTFLRLTFARDARGAVTSLAIDNWGPQPIATRDTAPEPPAPVAARVDPASYDAFVGEYELAPGFILAVTREGDRLMTQATGQAKVEIFPSGPTEFFLKVVNAQISFVKDATGAVTSLVLHQGGRDMPAKRIK